MSIKRGLKLFALVCIVILASIIPVPMPIFSNSKLPKNLIELVEKQKDADDEEDIKELF